MAKATQSQQIVSKVFTYISVIVGCIVLVIGGLALWAHVFVNDMVRQELSAQKIYFPEKGSKALDPATYPTLQKYAGQLVDTPEEAKAYANDFIGHHLKNAAGGKTYAEVSAEAMKNPTDQKLQQQRQTLFQGETLRGILLTSGYGFGMVGKIAGIAAYSAFVVGALLFVVAVCLRKKLSK